MFSVGCVNGYLRGFTLKNIENQNMLTQIPAVFPAVNWNRLLMINDRTHLTHLPLSGYELRCLFGFEFIGLLTFRQSVQEGIGGSVMPFTSCP
jgi:hypothetical protein